MPLKLSLPSNFSASASGSIQFSTGKKSAPHAKAYVSNGYTMNSTGFLANPSRSAQIAANNAGALTRTEAASMGLPLGGRK
jgi:hypothetical protein